MPYSFYGPDARGDFLCYFFNMTTRKFIIDEASKCFCCSDLTNLKIINCKCRGFCESTQPLPRSKKNDFGFGHLE